jgi:hypothetical protein
MRRVHGVPVVNYWKTKKGVGVNKGLNLKHNGCEVGGGGKRRRYCDRS